MNEYTYFILGILLGLSIALYLWANREENIEKKIKFNQRIFSTQKLDVTMESVVERISEKINEVKRDLTEDEKNEIITQCMKKNFI